MLLSAGLRLSAVAMIMIQCYFIVMKIPLTVASVDVLILSSGLIILGNFCTYLVTYTYGKNS